MRVVIAKARWRGGGTISYKTPSAFTRILNNPQATGELAGVNVVAGYPGGTGKPPVSPDETLEIHVFMEAADESKRQGGVPVTIESVLAQARAERSVSR